MAAVAAARPASGEYNHYQQAGQNNIIMNINNAAQPPLGDDEGCCLPLVLVEDEDAFVARQAAQGHNISRSITVNPQALQHIRTYFPRNNNARFKFIAITGKFRQGKSTLVLLLLSHLYQRAGMQLPRDSARLFEARGGSSPVTSGIWFWSKPIPLGNNEYAVLIDTEGTERGNDTLTAQLTAISAFVSSLLVYHNTGSFSNVDLQALASLQHTIRMVVSATDDEDEEGDLQQQHQQQQQQRRNNNNNVFSDLCIVSRTVSVDDLEVDRVLPQGTDPLDVVWDDARLQQRLNDRLQKTLLQVQVDDGQNEARRLITRSFPAIHQLVSLSADAGDIRLLKQTPQQPIPSIDVNRESGFGRSMMHVLNKLVEFAPLKRFGGVPARIDVLCDQFATFVRMVNEKHVDIPSLLYRFHMEQAKEEAIVPFQTYQRDMGQATSYASDAALQQAHDRHNATAVAAFDQALIRCEIMEQVRPVAKEQLDIFISRHHATMRAQLATHLSVQMNQEVEELKQAVAAADAKNEELNRKLEERTRALDEVKANIAAANQRIEDAKQQQQLLLGQIASLQHQLANASSGGGGGGCVVL